MNAASVFRPELHEGSSRTSICRITVYSSLLSTYQCEYCLFFYATTGLECLPYLCYQRSRNMLQILASLVALLLQIIRNVFVALNIQSTEQCL